MHIRALAIVVATATTTLVGGTQPVQAASGPLAPRIDCNATTNTITATVTGGSFAPGQRVNVDFKVTDGSFARQTTTSPLSRTFGRISQWGGTTTVPATVAADGTVSVTGYRRSWPAGEYPFYTESMQVTVRNSTGTVVGTSNTASCTQDTHTTATIECDQQTRTISARAAGRAFDVTESVNILKIEYVQAQKSQASPTSLPFVRYTYEPTHGTASDQNMNWTDPGYNYNVQVTNPYYLDETVYVKVYQVGGVGGGLWKQTGFATAHCVYADNR